MNSFSTAAWSVAVFAALWVLTMAGLVRPMFRDHGDDQGDGMTLVLLPAPALPTFARTGAFVAVFVVQTVARHLLDGAHSPDQLYRTALRSVVTSFGAAPTGIDASLEQFSLGLRVLVLAALVSLAITCRASPLRRAVILAQSLWYVAAVFLFDCLLVMVTVATGMDAGPATTVGAWFAIGVGFLGVARVLYANFALPKPTEVASRRRADRRDLALLIGTTAAAMAVSAAVLVLTYRASSPEVKPVLALFAPIPFSLLSYGVRMALLALIGIVVLTRPPVGDDRPPVDVIIPAYNEDAVIVDTLQAIDDAAVRYGGPVTVYLTDDGSTDLTRPFAERTVAGFAAATGAVIDGAHRGKSAALNLALSHTSADIVVRIDADTLIDPGALVHLPRWFRDPTIGIVEALMWPRWEKTPFHRMRLFEELRIFGLNHRVLQTVHAVNVVPGVFCAFRRRPAVELGGFTVGMNGEDGDFTMRMGRQGWRSRLDPDIRVSEGVPETFLEVREQRVRWSRATVHNQARHGLYRASGAPPMVWFSQTYQYFRRLRSPIFFVLPLYLAISSLFEATWRVPLVAGLVALAVAQIVFVVVTVALATGYGFGRHLGWVFLWPAWRYCLTMFSTESLLSLPARPSPRRRGAARVITEAVVH